MSVAEIRSLARKAGFSGAYFIPAHEAKTDFRKFYQEYLDGGYASSLKYLYKTEEKFDPKKILPEVKTLGIFPYFYRNHETETELKKARFKIARYAWGRDYHITLKKKLREIILKYPGSRAVTDSTPLVERYYGRLSGAGFIGKNGMLIHKEEGSFFLIAVIAFPQKLRNEDFPANVMHDFKFQECGTCTNCIEACPPMAILNHGVVDSNKCISALTIESSKEYQGKKHSWIFGCDICQTVCPYNKPSVFQESPDFSPGEIAKKIACGNLPERKEDMYGSPLKRAGIDKLRTAIQKVQDFT